MAPSTLPLQLAVAALYCAAGFGLALMLLNRVLLLWPDTPSKAILVPGVFLGLTFGAPVVGLLLPTWPWAWLPTAALALFLVEELNRWRIRRACTGSGPVESVHILGKGISPITTGDLVRTTYRVAAPEWHGRPLRIAHLTDLHVHPTRPRELCRKAMEAAADARPDIAVYTGDFVSRAAGIGLLPEALRPVGRIANFAVLGNHDYWTDPEAVHAMVEKCGITVLRDAHAMVEIDRQPVMVSATDWPWRTAAHRGESPPHTVPLVAPSGDLVPRAPAGVLHIALSHTPDAIYALAPSRAHFVFSGHHHAGQGRLPLLGAVVVPSVYGRRFDHGHYVIDGTHLFVSAGIGCVSPPFRVYCSPDVFIVEITGPAPAP